MFAASTDSASATSPAEHDERPRSRLAAARDFLAERRAGAGAGAGATSPNVAFAGVDASAPSMLEKARERLRPAPTPAVRASRFTYLGGGSPMHLRSVLKASLVWEALLEAWREGAVVAGSSAGAMVLTDPMVDSRGGALTVGLGMVSQIAVIPHFGEENAEKVHRSIALAAPGLPVVGIPERTALIRDPDGGWRQAGRGDVQVFVSGEPAGFDALPH